MPTHQADGTSFQSILPEDIDWQPFPSFPAVGPSRGRGR